MEIQTQEAENGTEIQVYTDKKIALLVKSSGSERIYLPGADSSSSTYYAESPNELIRTSDGYKVVHRGKVEDLEVIH